MHWKLCILTFVSLETGFRFTGSSLGSDGFSSIDFLKRLGRFFSGFSFFLSNVDARWMYPANWFASRFPVTGDRAGGAVIFGGRLIAERSVPGEIV